MPLKLADHFLYVRLDAVPDVIAPNFFALYGILYRSAPPFMSGSAEPGSGDKASAGGNSTDWVPGEVWYDAAFGKFVFIANGAGVYEDYRQTKAKTKIDIAPVPPAVESLPIIPRDVSATSEWDNRTDPPDEPIPGYPADHGPAGDAAEPLRFDAKSFSVHSTLEGADALRYQLKDIQSNIDLTVEPLSHLELLTAVAISDVLFLEERDKTYGSSWKKRGGVGAFMMLARKWDRIEQIMQKPHDVPGTDFAHAYDIFEQCEMNVGNVLDDVRDLRRYLTLAESELLRRGKVMLG